MKREVIVKCKGSRLLSIDDMHPIQGNLKDLSEARYKKLKKEIIELGYSEPISIWFDKKAKKWCILNGTQRHRTLRMMRDEGFTVPIIPVSELQADSLAQAKLKILALTSQYGEMTEEGLYEFLHESNIPISDVEASFEFAEIDMEHFKASYYEDVTGSSGGAEDEIPEARKTSIRLGDLFQLGNHRLLCGDSTNVVQTERLLNKQKIDLIYTDPPYGMGAVENSGVLKKKYRSIIGDHNPDLAKVAFKVWQADFPGIWWGANYYSSILPDASKWLVWDKNNGASDQTDCELAWTNLKGVVRQFTLASEKVNRVHPTQKPVALHEWALALVDNNYVADPFLGSGSTLIACEKTKRTCFGMEIDPSYCQVIIDRWEKFTSLKAIKIK